jgi:DNA polymerase III subunit gamma/tau
VPVRAGAIDADLLRERWPEVLDVVKGQRRIAWMLLGPATVESLEGGVLTVAFPKEGEAKGFASSGCDQVLASALGTLLGLNVRVRAVVGTGSAAPVSRAPARPAAAQAPQAPQAPASAAGPASSSEPDDQPDQAPVARAPAAEAGKPGGGAPSPRGAHDPPAAPPAPEEWPDDAGPAGDAPGPTGMELIQRQLGGRVIEEIEEP